MHTTTGTAVTSRQRAREQRLAGARERRRRLDPERLAREQRIDEATVDVEEAWEAVGQAQAALAAAELTVAIGVERLVAEKVTVAEVAELTGLDQSTIRRLRQLDTNSAAPDPAGPAS